MTKCNTKESHQNLAIIHTMQLLFIGLKRPRQTEGKQKNTARQWKGWMNRGQPTGTETDRDRQRSWGWVTQVNALATQPWWLASTCWSIASVQHQWARSMAKEQSPEWHTLWQGKQILSRLWQTSICVYSVNNADEKQTQKTAKIWKWGRE